ncbi:hypothetical protein EAH87_17075 [Sphingomonas koreensis]|nr:hypothetical protein EAH87_17075 [Sphingomonas koreensis]
MMVVLIVAIVIVGRIIQANIRAGHTRKGVDDAAETVENRQLRGEVQTLKERIAVLERLATDDNSSARLDREIEKLRDRS